MAGTEPMINTEPMTRPSTRSGRLPAGVYLLGFSLFAMGSAEFLLAGVLPAVAADLDVTLSSAGLLITAFAVGVVLGGPPFAVLSLRWPRRTALMVTQGVFAAGIAVGLLGDYQLLLLTRVLSGIAYAGFFAVASVTAIGLVTPDRNARASGVVVSGLSVAMVAGGPAGTLLSHFTDWRGGFWAVVVLTLAGVAGCFLGLPATGPGTGPGTAATTTGPGTAADTTTGPGPANDTAPGPVTAPAPAPRVSAELATMRRPQLWSMYAITVLTTAAYMITFNYLAALLTDITALPEVWVPALLALFGAGAFVGLSVGGRVSDRHPRRALLTGASAIVLLSILLVAAVHQVWAVVPTVFLLGVAAFVLNPAIYGRVFAIAADAPTLAGATTVSAFQLGISITPVLAAVAFTNGASLTSVCWIGAALALAAVPLVLLDGRGRSGPVPPVPPAA